MQGGRETHLDAGLSGQDEAGPGRQDEAQEAEGYDDASESHGHISSPSFS